MQYPLPPGSHGLGRNGMPLCNNIAHRHRSPSEAHLRRHDAARRRRAEAVARVQYAQPDSRALEEIDARRPACVSGLGWEAGEHGGGLFEGGRRGAGEGDQERSCDCGEARGCVEVVSGCD